MLAALPGKAGLLPGLALFLALTIACSSGESSSEASRLRVAVSTGVIADIVRNVAGPGVDVWPVVPPGGDPHTYWPIPSDIVRLQQSDLILTIGANLEQFSGSAAWRRAAREAGIPSLEFASQLELIKVDKVIDHGDHVHDLRQGDPHVWLDPAMVISMAQLTAGRLSELDPEHAAQYQANAESYRKQLLSLHEEIILKLTPVPQRNRKLLVLHDAYAYFAKRYGFEVIGYVTRTDNAEPSAEDVADLHRIVRAHEVRAVFKEPNHSAKILERLARHEDIPVGELLSDRLTKGVTTYIELMRFNAASIVRYLGE